MREEGKTLGDRGKGMWVMLPSCWRKRLVKWKGAGRGGGEEERRGPAEGTEKTLLLWELR